MVGNQVQGDDVNEGCSVPSVGLRQLLLSWHQSPETGK